MSRAMGVLLFAFGLGVLASIPIGAAQVEVIKRAIAGRFRSAVLSAAGSATADMAYGALALFGASRLGVVPGSLATWFWWLAPVILITVSGLTWRQALRVSADGATFEWAEGRVSYFTGFGVSIAYPPIMITWLVAMTLARQTGIETTWSPGLTAAFILAGGAGLFSYQAALAFLLSRVPRLRGERAVRLVFKGLAVVLACLALALLVNGAIHVLASGPR